MALARFQPWFREVTGESLNTLVDVLNGITPGTFKGVFNGTVGATTPALGAFTYVDQSSASGLTAAGTTRTDALVLSAAINNVTTAAASTGVVLPAASTVGAGGSVIVFNNGASAIKVYAAGSDTIDGTAGATGVTLTNALRCAYIVTASGTYLSAKLGATST